MWVCRLARLFVTSPVQLEATITQVVAEITKKSPSQIAPSANFRSDLGMTSLEHLELLLILESKFNVDVESQTEADSVSCVQSAADFVRRKQSSEA